LSTAPPDLDWEGPGLLGSAWRHRWLLLVATLLGGVLGLVFSTLQPVRYEGVASVLLATPESAQPGFDAERNVQNQVGIMTSAAVLGQAARRQGGGMTVDVVREQVTVDASQSSDVVAIRALDPTPAGAAKLADSVALAYEDVLAERRRREAQVAISVAQAQQARLLERLGQLGRALNADPGNPTLEAERDTVTERFNQALDEELQRETDLVRRPGGTALLQRAEVPADPAQPQRARNIALGALLFLVAGTALAWTLAGRRARPAPAPGAAAPPDPVPAAAPAGGPAASPEVLDAFDQLSSSMRRLPQAEAESAASRFGCRVVAILLDDGDGRLAVAGQVGLSPPEQRRVLRHDADAVRAALEAGPQVVGHAERARLARAGLPGGGAIRLVVPLVHDDVGFGLLLASPRPNGNTPGRFGDDEVAAIAEHARELAPALRSLVLLDRLSQRLRPGRPAPGAGDRPGAAPGRPG
jgi:capsular polysaccharide biosynthesis protein